MYLLYRTGLLSTRISSNVPGAEGGRRARCGRFSGAPPPPSQKPCAPPSRRGVQLLGAASLSARLLRPIRLPPAPGGVLLAAPPARKVVLELAAGAVLAHVEERASAADAEESDAL